MDFLSEQIERALAAQLYYLAVVCALTLPDVCSALESPDGNTNGNLYKSWCDTWFTRSYQTLTSDDLYSMRCGVDHQGQLGHRHLQYSRILFTMPIPGRHIILHNNVINDALNLDAVIFCRDMVNAMSRWYVQKKDDARVRANLPRLIQLHPNGLPPYIIGVPVIS